MILNEIYRVGSIELLEQSKNQMSPNSMLKNASSLNSLEHVKYAIGHGADIHYDKNIVLHYSVTNNNLYMVKYVIEQGLNFYEDSYLIKYPCIDNNIEIIKIMFDNKIDIHYDNDEALYYSFEYKNYDIFLFLLDNGLKIENILDNKTKNNMKQYVRKLKMNNLII